MYITNASGEDVAVRIDEGRPCTCGLASAYASDQPYRGAHLPGCQAVDWLPRAVGRRERPQPAFDALVARIATGFLVPACRYLPAPGKDWDAHEQWRPVNQAAGVVAGFVASFDAELVDRLRLAQNLVDASLVALANNPPEVPAALSEAVLSAKRMHAMIAGDKGLPKRVAECLLALGVGR